MPIDMSAVKALADRVDSLNARADVVLADSDNAAYEIAKQVKKQLEEDERAASKVLNAIPGVGTGPMGLTPNEIKSSPVYQKAQQAQAIAFKRLQAFNQDFLKKFKKEYAAERRR